MALGESRISTKGVHKGVNLAENMGEAVVRQMYEHPRDADSVHDMIHGMIEELAQLESNSDREYRASVVATFEVLAAAFGIKIIP